MPAKNTTYKSGKRYQTVSKELYKQFIVETGLDIDYKTFKDVIIDSLKEIANVVLTDVSGFKLPYRLGYWCVIKYKSKKNVVDFQNSKKYKKKIYLKNLHSFGHIVHIKWFRITNSIKNSLYPYRFEACRSLKRAVAKSFMAGKQYDTFSNSDFWTKSKMERTFYKYYKLTE